MSIIKWKKLILLKRMKKKAQLLNNWGNRKNKYKQKTTKNVEVNEAVWNWFVSCYG